MACWEWKLAELYQVVPLKNINDIILQTRTTGQDMLANNGIEYLFFHYDHILNWEISPDLFILTPFIMQCLFIGF